MNLAERQKRLLVIDDEENVRRVLDRILKVAGYDVATAATGKGALALLRSTEVDAVLVDVLMPELDGLEIIRALRRERPEVKILAISGGGTLDRQVCLEMARVLGADRTLSKPFDSANFLAIIAGLVGLP